MKKLYILLFLFTTHLLASPAQIVLMTSIETPKIWFHKASWDVTKTLERRFKKSFANSGYSIKIIHKASAQDLKTELQNPKNKGLFWVSHANQAQQVGSGIEIPDLVYTIDHVDVKNLFQKIHPNMKFLGLIGCRGESLIQKFKKEGHYKNNPKLKLFAFKKKVDPRSGLRKALKASLGSLGEKGQFLLRNFRLPNIVTSPQQRSSEQYSCQKNQFLNVTVERKSLDSLSSGSLTLDGHFIAFFPKSNNSIQSLSVQLPTHFFNQSKKKKIIFQKMDQSESALGTLTFSSSEPLSWKLFAKRDGTPIGKSKNLYLFKGDKTEIVQGVSECPSFE